MKKEFEKGLSPEEKRVMANCGTEAPFSGKLLYNKKKGIYRCAACGEKLFSSDSKFDSGTGWPSFDRVIEEGAVEKKEDRSLGMRRTEILCKNCGAHLGHVFPDGPTKTGKRFCVNSVSLEFEENEKD